MSLLTRRKADWPLITDFFEDEDFNPILRTTNWSPAVNISDTDKEYEIEVSAPGLKKKDFNVSIENGVMTIKGSSEHEEEEKKKNYTRREFSARSFNRSFTLPDNIEQEHVKAKYRDGILKLRLEKKASAIAAKKKEIAID